MGPSPPHHNLAGLHYPPFDHLQFLMLINGGAQYAISTNLLITFPGVIADFAAIGETADLSDAVTLGFGDNLPYSLKNDSNGTRTIYYSKASDGNGDVQDFDVTSKLTPEIDGAVWPQIAIVMDKIIALAAMPTPSEFPTNQARCR